MGKFPIAPIPHRGAGLESTTIFRSVLSADRFLNRRIVMTAPIANAANERTSQSEHFAPIH
jgi:hypothetical protein